MNGSEKRILIIEDDAATAAILEVVVLSVVPRAQIWFSSSAESAMVQLRRASSEERRDFDLIVADIFLNGKETGLEVWQACQRLCPLVPLVVTSSLGLDSFFHAIGSNAVAPPFLAKPLQIGESQQMIRALLQYDENRSAA